MNLPLTRGVMTHESHEHIRVPRDSGVLIGPPGRFLNATRLVTCRHAPASKACMMTVHTTLFSNLEQKIGAADVKSESKHHEILCLCFF